MHWQFKTKAGPVSIVVLQGRYHVIFEEQSLGSYETPQQAADDASGGCTFMPSSGVDLGTLGIPDDLSEWAKLK